MPSCLQTFLRIIANTQKSLASVIAAMAIKI